ncbi:MAG: beta-lactamase family protein [Brevibacterium sp.]|uniref:serine hydrolase domain-containing protein n=1 Tax=Brevibacterium sp. TaxID=1701 RepID=UPI002648BA48|nr:serine hydrolase [Brevibacterium sp.]MDN5807852.1 beta-lactamase family protein [Brevibacterium sp.]MDN5832976.1 beta-lactamase family protein [Brevibacterium sp.]MDN5877358.1 beta-lactamase family protein [Brevibacterium sp.]MDN6158436.1 beta-lactamase family protein [Brevibacterium sp.]MDN6175694.1 beta-lactamase family protein [Brevibacterium sp.]
MADGDKTLPGSPDESGKRRFGALSGSTKGIGPPAEQTGGYTGPPGSDDSPGDSDPPSAVDPSAQPQDIAGLPPLPRAGDLTSASEDSIVDPSEAILERIDLDSWKWPEYFAFSLTRMEELFPVGGIPRGIGPVRDLVTEENDFRPLTIDREKWPAADEDWSTVGDVLANTFTDAWLVARDGVALAEEYAWPMKPARQHMLFSISKSIVSAVIGALTDAGHLSPDDLVTTRVPALSQSGYAGATIRDLLDMRSGIKFSEEYLKKGSEIRALFEAVDFAPRTAASANGIKDFLKSLTSESEHGGPFVYRSCETDVLAWICESVVGQPFSVIASEYVWSKIGAAHAAQVCQDRWGGSIADGAISTTLRDLARFGEMIARGGTTAEGERVLSGAWIDDIFTGGADSARVFADAPSGRSYPGGMYRSQFWVPSASRDVVIGIGIHGQMLYIDRSTQTVGVKLSSDPQPVSLAHQHGTLAMFEAIAEAVPPKPEPGTVPPAASTAEHSAAPPSTAVSSTARRGAAPAGAAPSIAPRPFAAQPGIF